MRYGPVSPNAGIRTITAFGFTDDTRSHVTPRRSMLTGTLFSITPSEIRRSRSNTSWPSGRVMSMVIAFLFRPWWLKTAYRFHGRSPASLSG